MNNEEKQRRGRIIPIAHQERRSILFYSLIFFWYGFFIDFKPSEPFLVPYLIKEKNFTNHEIEDRIFPLWTYAYFVAVVLCGLMSEVIQYKPLIVIGSLARVATRIILIVGTSLIAMQATQFTFGLASGTEVIFYAYIYYLVPYSQYQKLTGITRASVLVGHVGANLLGQLLVSKFHSPLIVLFYISLGAICIATGISVFFPSVTIELKSCSQNFQGMKGAFMDLVANRDALPWTLWLIFSSFTNDLVLNYATTLFEEVDPSKDWNGLVMAIVRLSGALGAVLPAIHYIDCRMEKSRRIVVTGITILAGVAMILTAFSNIYVVYALLVYYMGAITFGTSVASAQIAKSMSTRKFALVFSVITIVYLGIETLVQFIIGAQALDLDSRIMFIVFGGILVVNAVIFTGINILAYRSRVHKDYAALSTSPSSSSTYVDQSPLSSFASPTIN